MRHPILSTVLATLLGLTACDKARTLLGAPDAGNPQVPTGDPAGGPGGPTASIQLSHCTPCHGTPGVEVANADPLVSVAPPRALLSETDPGLHRSHLVDGPFRRAVECASCHLVPTAANAHPAQKQGRVSFSRLATTSWAGAPVVPAWDGATCAGTYCHGNFKNGANAAPTWAGGAGTVVCGSCHGVDPTRGPGGTHPTFSSAKTCGSCHGGTYTSTTVDLSLHMNGVLDAPSVSCSSCHGDDARVPVASATAVDPNGANLVKASPPLDAGHGAAATGAHLAHVNQGDAGGVGPLSEAIACATCHPVPTSVGHSDGTVDVVFGGLATSGGAAPAAYDFTTHTCASTYCHGNFAGGAGANAMDWTVTTKQGCTSCHGAPPGPTSATVHHPPNGSCDSCHAGYAGGVNAATHVNGTVEHAPATGCTQCHGDLAAAGVANTDVRAAPGSDASAVDAHGDPATATTVRGVGAHGKHLTGTTWRATPIPCSECHAVPATDDETHANGDPALTFGLLASTAWSGQPAVTPAWNGAGGAATVTCSSVYCHGAFPNGTNASPTWTAPGSVTCGSCHGSAATGDPTPGGTHPAVAGQSCGGCHGGSYDCVSGTACTSAGIDPALHMNGVVDGGGESPGGLSCGGCHTALFAAMNGTVTHVSRHALGNVAGTNDAPADSGITWGNPLSANAPVARSCVSMCHGDHPHDLTSPATATHENNAYLDATSAATRADGTANRIGAGGTGGTPNRTGSDYDGTQANGGMCISCHRNPVDAARPAIDPAAFDASAHDFTSNTVGATTYTWSYALHDGGRFARDCTKCHASSAEGTTPAASGTGVTAVHYGDDASLLAGAKTPAGTAAGFVCYNCHGSAATPAAGAQGNRSGKDIQSQIAHATAAGQSGHPADSDSVHDSAAEYANAAFGNALGVAAGAGQRHASCLDCHDPHEAKPTGTATRVMGSATNGNVAGPALQGAWGVSWTGTLAGWATPASANFTKTPITAGTDLEATLCLKCHSAYYGTLPTSPSGGFTETDQAKELNPSNAGFHPVLASSSGNLGGTGNVLSPWTRTSLMTCTDCHASDATADPSGPHGSAARFVLKGPNTAWDSTLTLVSGGMPAGTFCANCHDATFAGSRYSAHTNSNHQGVSCMTCHAAIPHGGPRPGMLVSSIGTGGGCTPTGGVIAGWDTTAPYANASATDGLCIKSYPATNTTNWARSNCGCNGSNH